MAKKKTNLKNQPKKNLKPSFNLSNQQKLVFGSFLVILGILLCIAFISFFFTGEKIKVTFMTFHPGDEGSKLVKQIWCLVK